MAKQTITIVVDTNRDQDILRWLEGQTNKSAAVRDAIRASFYREGITLGDIYSAIQELKQGDWIPAPGVQSVSRSGEEPDDLAAALDRLGL